MSVDSNVKDLMPLGEDVHVTTQGYMQQHDAEGDMNTQEDTHRGETTRMKFMNIQMEYSRMRSESSVYMWETAGAFLKQLENQNSLGELLRETCTGSLGDESGRS